MIKEEDVYSLINAGKINDAGRCIVKGLAEGADFSKSAVVFAHMLVISFPWKSCFKLVQPMWNHLYTSGWLNSLALGRPLNVNNKPIPWITYAAIDFLDSVVKPEWNVFEWGSGNSTLWWSGKVSSVLASESSREWQEEVSKKMPPNAKVLFGGTVQEYLDIYRHASVEKFDVVVIDGDHRNECAKIACDKLAPGGIIVFDNSDMMVHDEGMKFLTDKGLYRMDFWGLIPSYLYKNCTSVFFTDEALPRMLKNRRIPGLHESSVGPSCQQVIDAPLRAAAKSVTPD